MVWEGRSREASPYPDFAALFGGHDASPELRFGLVSEAVAHTYGILWELDRMSHFETIILSRRTYIARPII